MRGDESEGERAREETERERCAMRFVWRKERAWRRAFVSGSWRE